MHTCRRAVKGPNLILLSHIDVVGADPSEWTCPPFEAREIDGYIYGRGTVDTKQLTVMELAAFLNLKTLQKDQNRDVYLVVNLRRGERKRVWAEGAAAGRGYPERRKDHRAGTV